MRTWTLSVLALASSLPAQAVFVDLGGEHLPYGTRSSRVAFADLDRDGLPDLLSIGHAQPARWLRNAGGARFVPTATPLFLAGALEQAVADVDNDGDLDVVLVGVQQAYLVTMLNDGRGNFSPYASPVAPFALVALALGDLDGDTFPDLALSAQVLLNDRRGGFAAGGSLPPSNSVALLDVENDGDLDIVLGQVGSYGLRLRLNNGAAVFTDGTASLPPSTDGYRHVAITAIDVEGDGDQDLVTGSYLGLQLFENRGGFFVVPALPAFPTLVTYPSQVQVVDLDGDGRLDVVVAALAPASAWVNDDRVFLNAGNRTFVDATSTYLGPGPGGSATLAAADVDRDGDVDLCFGRPQVWQPPTCTGAYDRLLLHQGTRPMADATQHPLLFTPMYGVAGSPLLADLDGDGALDLIAPPNNPSATPRMFLNDGRGTYRDATDRLPAGLVGAEAAAAGDVDGDGDQDVVVGGTLHTTGGLRLLRNDGTGRLQDASNQLQVRSPAWPCVLLVDVDGDGDLDLVSGGGSFLVQANDGAGNFTMLGGVGLSSTTHLVAADVDRDGDQDLLAAADRVSLLQNQGGGTFVDVTATHMPATVIDRGWLAPADYDRDGLVDLVVAQWNGALLAYRNQGAGVFRDESLARMPSRVASLARPVPADVDGDGDLDILAVPLGQPPLLYVNDGSGRFADHSAASFPAVPLYGPAMVAGDVDRDGDADLVSAHGAVFLNLTRQLSVPYLPIVGTTTGVRLHALLPAGQVAAALVWVGPALPAPVVVPPFGVLHLDLARAAALASVALAGPIGTGIAALPIPAVRALGGLRLTCQALIVPPALLPQARLTNAHELIVPR